MVKGGYQIIDFKDVEFTDDVGMVVPNIYDKIEGTRKAILVSGLNFEGKEINDFFTNVKIDGTRFTLLYYAESFDDTDKLFIEIEDNDVVTIKRN